LFLAHALMIPLALARYRRAGFLFGQLRGNQYPADYGYDLWVVYAVWIAVVAMMYPLCLWFARVKERRQDWWLLSLKNRNERSSTNHRPSSHPLRSRNPCALFDALPPVLSKARATSSWPADTCVNDSKNNQSIIFLAVCNHNSAAGFTQFYPATRQCPPRGFSSLNDLFVVPKPPETLWDPCSWPLRLASEKRSEPSGLR
jgi:hypothetical protein